MGWRRRIGDQCGSRIHQARQPTGAQLALVEVHYERIEFFAGESSGDVELELVVDAERAHVLTPTSESPIFLMPLRIRLLTVPSGWPSFLATSA